MSKENKILKFISKSNVSYKWNSKTNDYTLVFSVTKEDLEAYLGHELEEDKVDDNQFQGKKRKPARKPKQPTVRELLVSFQTQVNERFDKVDKWRRLDKVDARLDKVDSRLDVIEQDVSLIKSLPTIQRELKEAKKPKK